MKKHYLIALSVAILAGCSKSGTGRYEAAQSDRSSSLEARGTNSRYGTPLSATNTVAQAASPQNLDTNAPLPSLGTPGSAGTESGKTTGETTPRITAGQSGLNITTPNPTYQPGPLDKALSDKVKTSLHISDADGKAIDLSNIDISAAKGVVTLKGTVQSEAQRQAIGGEVQRMNGVVLVKNELKVSSEGTAQGSPSRPEQSGTSSSKKD